MEEAAAPTLLDDLGLQEAAALSHADDRDLFNATWSRTIGELRGLPPQRQRTACKALARAFAQAAAILTTLSGVVYLAGMGDMRNTDQRVAAYHFGRDSRRHGYSQESSYVLMTMAAGPGRQVL